MVRYGTVTKIQKANLPRPLPSRRPDGVIGFVRIALTVVEVATTFLTGGLSVPAETALSFAFGLGNEAIDAWAGNLSIQGSLLNLGLPFAGGAASALVNKRAIRKITDLANVEDVTIGKLIYASEDNLVTQIGQNSKEFFEDLQKLKTPPNILGSSRQIKEYSENIKELLDAFYKKMEKIQAANKLVEIDIGYTAEEIEGAKFIARSGDVATDAEEEQRTFKTSDKVLGFLGVDVKDADSQWLVKELVKFAKKPRKAGEFEEFFNKYLSILDRSSYKNKAFLKDLEQSEKAAFEEGVAFDRQSAFIGSIKKRYGKTPFKKKKWSFFESVRKKGYAKTIGTRAFNDKVVQRVQLIDPNDLGRAIPERIYQWASKKIKGSLKLSAKALKRAQSLEEAFVSTGGITVSSKWHLGYRVIRSEGFMHFIQINFLPEPSYNKNPVFVWANDKQLAQYIASPGRTYLKYWSLSRGGRKLSSYDMFRGAGILKMVAGVTGYGAAVTKIEGSLMTAFMNVQALRNLISITSNIVENVADMKDGSYGKNYFAKFQRSLTFTSVSRVFRLGGRTVGWKIGGQLGQFIGRELARYGTQVGAFSIKWKIEGKKGNFANALKNQIIKAGLASARSNTLKYARKRNPNSAIIKTLSVRRKARIYARIPNAVMPGRPWTGYKLQKSKNNKQRKKGIKLVKRIW